MSQAKKPEFHYIQVSETTCGIIVTELEQVIQENYCEQLSWDPSSRRLDDDDDDDDDDSAEV